MSRDHLPTVPATTAADDDDGCPGCTRRTMVQTLGVTAAASLLGLGCRDDGAAPAPDAGDPLAGTAMCGDNLCVDINHPANALLQGVNGSRVISLADDKLLIVRRSEVELVVLSAVCTHAGCTVRFDAAGEKVVCPCHGSQYSLTGAVTRSPAPRALTRYEATLDGAGILTIIL